MLLQGPSRTLTSVGFVKWFGGYNKTTGKTNEFGFIEAINGDDLFVHASQLNGDEPKEGDFAVFAVDQIGTGKERAVDVSICSNVETYDTEALVEFLHDTDGLQMMLGTTKYRAFLRSLVNRNNNEWALDFFGEILFFSKAALYVVGEMMTDRAAQSRLLRPLGIDGLDALDATFEYVPSYYFDNEHAQFILWLKEKTPVERDYFLQHKIDDLSTSFVLACVFEGLIQDSDMLGHHTEDVAEFTTQVFKNRFISSQKSTTSISLLDYVRDTYRSKFSGFDEFSSCPVIASFFELLKIKQKIFSKDRSFVCDIERSGSLSSDPEAFVLSKLIPLIWDGNDDISVEAAFFHEVWKALLTGQLDIDHPGFQKLFPSCRTLGPRLSCEAIFWRKEKLYLCRGRRCNEPKVIPDCDKPYLDFNIYDWLSYFGRSYEKIKQPSRRDFPIKLAGYFNRLRELRKVLDCRVCGDLMKPDFKYSRVKIKVYDAKTQTTVTKQFSAAYRCTVFYCDNSECNERGNKHYLNHCLGQKCDKMIDSRDLGKCENGFYRCSCGSCCREHQIAAENRKKEVEQLLQGNSFRRKRR